MPIVRFFGFTLPSGIDISINKIPDASWREDALDLHMTFRTKIIKRSVEVECVVNQYRRDFLSMLYMRALDLARVPVDLMAFSTGYSVTVCLDSYCEPDLPAVNLWFLNATLAPLCTSFTTSPTTPKEEFDLSKTIALVGSEPAFFMALNDLIQANTVPHYAPVNCGRAIDGIRILMTPAGTDADKGWAIMRANLNIEKKYLRYVTDLSRGPRHGDRTYIPAPEVQESIKRSWTIMDRFIEYRKRGNQSLPILDFPMLS